MDLKDALYLWAKCDQERKQQLIDWRDEAVIKCAQNLGKNVASTSANGVAVSFLNDSLTISEWLLALTRAIELIDNPLRGQRKAKQIFR